MVLQINIVACYRERAFGLEKPSTTKSRDAFLHSPFAIRHFPSLVIRHSQLQTSSPAPPQFPAALDEMISLIISAFSILLECIERSIQK